MGRASWSSSESLGLPGNFLGSWGRLGLVFLGGSRGCSSRGAGGRAAGAGEECALCWLTDVGKLNRWTMGMLGGGPSFFLLGEMRGVSRKQQRL